MWRKSGERKILRQVCTLTVLPSLKPLDLSCRCHFLRRYNFQDKRNLQTNQYTDLTKLKVENCPFCLQLNEEAFYKTFPSWITDHADPRSCNFNVAHSGHVVFLKLSLFCCLGLLGQQSAVGLNSIQVNGPFYSLRSRNCYVFLTSNFVPLKRRTSRR